MGTGVAVLAYLLSSEPGVPQLRIITQTEWETYVATMALIIPMILLQPIAIPLPVAR